MDESLIVPIVVFVLFVGLMFWQQRQARRRRDRQIAQFNLGDEIVTVGGIVGKLTQLDVEQNRARLEIAPGVEIQVVIAALGRKVEP